MQTKSDYTIKLSTQTDILNRKLFKPLLLILGQGYQYTNDIMMTMNI